MYHIINPNTLYDIVNENRIELNLFKAKEKYDIAQFLDDISMWMDGHRDIITENYLPFSVLSVGIVPIQVSAFMYGLFVGKALEKSKLTIKSLSVKVTKDEILKEIEKNLNYYHGLMGEGLENKLKEFKRDDTEEQDPGNRSNK